MCLAQEKQPSSNESEIGICVDLGQSGAKMSRLWSSAAGEMKPEISRVWITPKGLVVCLNVMGM